MVYVVRRGVLTEVAGPQNGDVPVYSIQDCASRIQNPDDRTRGGDPEHPERSAIPPQTFTHTVARVDATIRDFHNEHGQNLALWLDGDYALRYANIDQRLHGVERMIPQPNLATDSTHVTVILPTVFARRRVIRVCPSDDCQRETERGGATVAAYGLQGQVEQGEIFGITVAAIRDAMQSHSGFIELWYPDPDRPDGPPQMRALLDLFSRSDLHQFLGRRFER